MPSEMPTARTRLLVGAMAASLPLLFTPVGGSYGGPMARPRPPKEPLLRNHWKREGLQVLQEEVQQRGDTDGTAGHGAATHSADTGLGAAQGKRGVTPSQNSAPRGGPSARLPRQEPVVQRGGKGTQRSVRLRREQTCAPRCGAPHKRWHHTEQNAWRDAPRSPGSNLRPSLPRARGAGRAARAPQAVEGRLPALGTVSF